MDRSIQPLYQVLQKLVGFHRRLLDVVRLEHDTLVRADIKAIQTVTGAKQGLIESIQTTESERVKLVAELSIAWKKSFKDLSLTQIIIFIQGNDPKGAEQLRSAMNALAILIKRISEQNEQSRALVEQSLKHIQEMKKNVLGALDPKGGVYNKKGAREGGQSASRLISKEI